MEYKNFDRTYGLAHDKKRGRTLISNLGRYDRILPLSQKLDEDDGYINAIGNVYIPDTIRFGTYVLPNGGDFYYIYIPCESDCCARQLRVCNNDGVITVKDIGFAGGSSSFNCSLDSEPLDITNLDEIAYQPNNCFDLDCDVFADIEMDNASNYDYDRHISFLDIPPVGPAPKQSDQGQSFNNFETRDVVFMYNIHNTNSELELTIRKSKLENITVNINHILGELNISKSFDLCGSFEMFNIDISNLPNGTYVCNIVSKGNIYGTSKFVIIK